MRFLWQQRSAVHVMVGSALTALWGWGLMWWTPTFLMRTYGMTTGEAGAIIGPINLWAGIGATVLTGGLLARPSMFDPRRIVWLLGGIIGVVTVPSIIIYGTHSLPLAKALFWIFIPSIYFYIGPIFGLLNNLAQPRMRAMFCAATLFVANVGNLIVAPKVVGHAERLVRPGPRRQCRLAAAGAAVPGASGLLVGIPLFLQRARPRSRPAARHRHPGAATPGRGAAGSRMKLRDIKTFVVGNPPPHYGGRYFVFVKLTTDQNVTGVGEAYCVPVPSAPGRAHARGRVRALPAGPGPARHRDACGGGSIRPGFTQHPDLTLMGVLSALEMACWDIIGKEAGQPVYKLLGGRVHERLRSYTYIYARPGDKTDVYQDPDLSAERAVEYLRQGFTAHQVRSGRAVFGLRRPPAVAARARRCRSASCASCARRSATRRTCCSARTAR